MSDLSQAALRGDTEAMFRLSAAFAFGFEDMPMDTDEAMHWLQKAAKAGHPTAEIVLQDVRQVCNVSVRKLQKRDKNCCLSMGDTKTIVLPGGAEMEMIYCALGSFIMGSPEDEELRAADENQHKVTLTKGFWLGKYPVTQVQWNSVMGSNPSWFGGDDNPVDSVSWKDCKEFIAKINSQSNLNARFPTEAEWEYACRAGSEGVYSGIGDLDEMGWYGGNCDEEETHPVGELEPNDWGFCDMHGNVWEWCADWYGSYPTKAVTDPKGPASGDDRVLRGGGCSSNACACRSAYRNFRDSDYGDFYYGFRLCCSAGPHE